MKIQDAILRAGTIYAGLKTILNSVGLENDYILPSIIKYFSFCYAIVGLMEEEVIYVYPYIISYFKEVLTKNFYYYKNFVNHHLYNEKIISLCSKDNDFVQEYQKKILNKICAEHNASSYAQESLFATSHDNFKALCIILGDHQELCSELL